jgi:hypothetical protein
MAQMFTDPGCDDEAVPYEMVMDLVAMDRAISGLRLSRDSYGFGLVSVLDLSTVVGLSLVLAATAGVGLAVVVCASKDVIHAPTISLKLRTKFSGVGCW